MKPAINHIDGWLYVTMAVCTAAVAALTSSEAAQFMNASTIWLIKTYAELLGAACLAGKTYRSTTFARAQDAAGETPALPGAVPSDSSKTTTDKEAGAPK